MDLLGHSRRRGPRLQRRNAMKNVDYDASSAAASPGSRSPSSPSETPGLRAFRSLDLAPSCYSKQSSFRIGGSVEGEVDHLCLSLGLSGPDDFTIPLAAWEACKARSSPDLLPRSRLLYPDSHIFQKSAFDPNSSSSTDRPADLCKEPICQNVEVKEGRLLQDAEDVDHSRQDTEVQEEGLAQKDIGGGDLSREDPGVGCSNIEEESKKEDKVPSDGSVKILGIASRKEGGDGGIKGVRPPVLTTPPPISPLYSPPSGYLKALARPPSVLIPMVDKTSSTWDILKSFAPENEEHASNEDKERRRSFGLEEEEVEDGISAELVELRGMNLGETSEAFTRTSSLSTTNDDDTSSTTTDTMFIVSPNGRFKRRIKSWMRGMLLGSGSFGVVYEGISSEGVFFAVKEVSLLDQGSKAQQCIDQLEQEITLLSQFEHGNIVQYYGTDKEESKLYIFLELVTQGSLASLYQKYHLRDTQVSAYTRQILSGLVYLHDRNVVHRDVKCANILVHANGSVKLADFGLAKEITKFNMLKSCKGSVYWMAPEVVQPKRTYGPAADIWSLGCTVLEMLTHRIPYPDLEWTQALFKIGRGEPPPLPSSLSRDAHDFISQCNRVNPEDRPSAHQLLEHPFVNQSLHSSSSGSNGSSRSQDRWG